MAELVLRRLLRTLVGEYREHMHQRAGAHPVGLEHARTNVELARTNVELARTNVELARTSVGLARGSVGLARTSVGLARAAGQGRVRDTTTSSSFTKPTRCPNWICTYFVLPRTTTCSAGSKVVAE